MNKEVKQLFIKLAIIVGVIILSAFISTVNAYFTPNHGDVSVSSNFPNGVPTHYYATNYASKAYLCGHKSEGENDPTADIWNESTYSGSSDGAGYQQPSREQGAQETGILGIFSDGLWLHNNGQHWRLDRELQINWGNVTPEYWIGTTEISIQWPDEWSMRGSMDISGFNTFTFSGYRVFRHTPEWQQAGELSAEQLKIPILNKNAYLNHSITVNPPLGMPLPLGPINMTLGQMGFQDFWDKIIQFTNDHPVHTTVLSNAKEISLHKYRKQTVDDVVFHYIYAEADVSGDPQPESPVQIANWLALGQISNVGGVGQALYEEAKEYAKFIKETKGELKKEFIDVKDDNGKIIPVEVSSDEKGDILVGPFAIDYTEWGIDAGRGWAQFAGIYDLTVTTNDKPTGLNEDEYELVYNSNSRIASNLVKPYYPHSKEVFYVKIKKAANRTEFRDLDFKFRYLNVSGSAIEIEENLYYYKWTIDDDGTDWYLKGEKYEENTEQAQDIDIRGSRSYITDELHYGMYPVRLSITKNVVNKLDGNNSVINANEISQGQELTLGKTYKFKVTLHSTRDDALSGKNPIAEYTINLKDNQTESITKYFAKGTSYPYFRVEEIDTGGAAEVTFKIAGRDINTNTTFKNGICGRFEEKNATYIECSNGYEFKSADITLTKKTSEPVVEDEIYKLKLDITDNANKILKDYSSALENSIEFRVLKGQTEAEVYIDGKPTGKKEIHYHYVWLGNNNDAPFYKVTEENNANYIVTFNGTAVDKIEGQFEDKFDGKVRVDAVNSRPKSRIYIDKQSDEPLQEDRDYFFKIKVGGTFEDGTKEKNVTLTIKKGETRVESDVFTVYLENKTYGEYDVYEYPDKDSQLADNGGDRKEHEDKLHPLTAAEFNDKSKFTKVSLLNKQEPKDIEYKIEKSFKAGDEPKDDVVFTFDTSAVTKDKDGNDKNLSHELRKASKGNSWTTELVHVEWLYSDQDPTITIKEETDQNYVIDGLEIYNGKTGTKVDLTENVHYEKKDKSTLIITQAGVQKLLEVQNTGDVDFVFKLINRVEEYHAKIVINKIVQKSKTPSGVEVINPDDPNEYTFKFLVQVQGESELRELIVSNKQKAETIISWQKDVAKGYDAEKGPQYTIYEVQKEGFSLTELVINGEKINIESLPTTDLPNNEKGLQIKQAYASINQTEILVDATNTSDNQGSINIKKLLVDRFGETVEDSTKVFTFKIETTEGPSGRVEEVSVEVGKSATYTATWPAGASAPTFEITEMKLDGHAVKDIVVENNDNSSNPITKENGKINIGEGSVSGSFEGNKTINIKYTNEEVIPLKGTVTITKKVASTTGASIPDDYNKTFNFTIDITTKNGTTTKNFSLTKDSSHTEAVEWNSNDEMVPTYTIREDGNPNLIVVTKGGVPVDTDSNGTVTGNFQEKSDIDYEYTNGVTVHSGQLILSKQLNSGSVDINEEFFFNVKIGGENLPVVVLKAGDAPWESKVYTWVEGEEAPEYTVTEENVENSRFLYYIMEDGSKVKSQTVSGRLRPKASNNDGLRIVCINETNQNHANASIKKIGVASTVKNPSQEDLRDKYGGKGFVVDVSVVYDKGKFKVGNTEYSPENAFKTTITSLNVDQTYDLPEITWFGSDNEGPKVIVNEVSMPDGWRLLYYNNNNVVLTPGANEKIEVYNEWGNTFISIPMGGTVWIDSKKDEKNTENSKINGKMDSNEVGLPGVGVVVKRYLVDKDDNIIADTGYAKAYDLNGEEVNQVFPIYTDETGRWDVRYLEIPGIKIGEQGITGAIAVKYGVEYIYDGYTFEPTIYLAGANGDSDINKAKEFYTNSKVTTRNAMIDRSFALDNADSRTAFNNRFGVISGDSSIATDNSTSGYAIGTDGNIRELKYKGTQVAYQGKTHLVSELITADSEGRALPDYQVKSYTLFNSTNPVGKQVKNSGLAYPFDLKFNVALASRTIKGDTYVATDPYLRNVNLGLVYRENADTEVTKQVDGAKVIVNQKMREYNFTSLQVLSGNEYLNINGNPDDNLEEVSYELGLYKSDYYYRAQAYATSEAVYKGLQKFYKDIQLGDDYEALMNLQAYVTYKIRVRNTSPTMAYDVAVRSIVDYSDNSLELVRGEVKNYIKGDSSVGTVQTVAVAPYYITSGQTTKSGNMKIGPDVVVKDTISSRSYNKVEMTFDNPVRLSSGGYVDIYATYRLKKYSEDLSRELLTNGSDGDIIDRLNLINADGIELGDKANIAEMKSFTVYYANTNNLAGRVDKDSAPNNLDIIKRNNKDYFEDDSYSSPVIRVTLNDSGNKNVSGTVWEDSEIVSDSQAMGVALGDGRMEDTEGKIGGMNIELVEKIQIPTVINNTITSEYYEYDYTWPENYDIQKNTVTTDDGAKQTLKALTGFDATIASSSENGTKGAYTFTNIPTGSYIVRFHYGDNNGGYTDRTVTFATGSTLTEGDVYKFPAEAGGDYMKSSLATAETNTSHYDGDVLPAVYNGQDFKSAAYGLGLTVEWLTGSEAADISKAADSQARRLEVINKSRVLTNTNTTLMATANNLGVSHKKLYDEYRMFADTPKIRVDVNDEDFGNVNFGVVERPETRLVLDKEIEEMVLKDNSNRELIKVKYDISYLNDGVLEQRNDGSYILVNPEKALTVNTAESFGLEYLQSLNKFEDKYGFIADADGNRHPNIGVQNFRYIVYDTSMATSLTLETTYRITALNLGQADRTTKLLQDMSSDDIMAVSQILKANKFSTGDSRTYTGESYGAYSVSGDKLQHNNVDMFTITNRFSDVLGKTYYSNIIDTSDTVVRTKVGQVIDYVDNSLEFKQDINTGKDASWTSTTDSYLYHNDIIDKSIFTTVEYNVLLGDAATSEMKSKVMDKDGQYYDTTSQHNIILSVTKETEEENNTNVNFLKKLVPKSQSDDGQLAISAIKLKTNKSIDSQEKDLIFDNIAEIIRYENEVGRKTITTVTGNADPKGMHGSVKLGEFAGALSEIDSSATEIITFSNPYGISDRTRFITEITIGVFSALVIIAVGIVIVKKKVL